MEDAEYILYTAQFWTRCDFPYGINITQSVVWNT